MNKIYSPSRCHCQCCAYKSTIGSIGRNYTGRLTQIGNQNSMVTLEMQWNKWIGSFLGLLFKNLLGLNVGFGVWVYSHHHSSHSSHIHTLSSHHLSIQAPYSEEWLAKRCCGNDIEENLSCKSHGRWRMRNMSDEILVAHGNPRKERITNGNNAIVHKARYLHIRSNVDGLWRQPPSNV